jgi:hypothetical protein
MKKVIFSFTIILLIGFVCQKMSYAAGISRYYIGYNNGIVNIVPNEIGDFGYTYLGTLGWKTNTKEPETTPGGWVYIWKKDGNYYWSGDRHPKNSNEIKRINRDNIGFYIYYYGDSRVYLSYSTGAGYPLVTNIEKQVWPY